jgi:hypothetical protein
MGRQARPCPAAGGGIPMTDVCLVGQLTTPHCAVRNRCRQVPPAWLFPLPLPAEQHKHAAAAAAAAAHTASLKLPASAEPLPQGPSQPPQRQQLLTSPTSLLAALQRDQFFTGSAPCSRPATPSLVAAGSAAVSSSSCTGASKLGAAAVAKEATLQLLALHLPQGSSLYSDPGSPVSARARGGWEGHSWPGVIHAHRRPAGRR